MELDVKCLCASARPYFFITVSLSFNVDANYGILRYVGSVYKPLNVSV